MGFADVVGAAHALNRFDDDRRRVGVDECVRPRAGLSRGVKLTSNGVRGKPYHFSTAPQVTAPAAAVRPCQPCSQRHGFAACR